MKMGFYKKISLNILKNVDKPCTFFYEQIKECVKDIGVIDPSK